jgi:hypothetical protein
MTPVQREDAIKKAQWFLILGRDHYNGFISDPEFTLVLCHFREGDRAALVGLARAGWGAAHDLLCKMAEVLTSFGDRLPGWLQEYVVWAAMYREAQLPMRRRGCDPLANLVRNTVIAQTVDMLAFRSRGLQLRPTRNAATAGESACSIVAEALGRLRIHMTEANVTRIWREERDTVKREREARKRELAARTREVAAKLKSLRVDLTSRVGGEGCGSHAPAATDALDLWTKSLES